MSGRDEERKQRLAEALRENLKKRKAQSRGEEPVPAAQRIKGASSPPEAS